MPELTTLAVNLLGPSAFTLAAMYGMGRLLHFVLCELAAALFGAIAGPRVKRGVRTLLQAIFFPLLAFCCTIVLKPRHCGVAFGVLACIFHQKAVRARIDPAWPMMPVRLPAALFLLLAALRLFVQARAALDGAGTNFEDLGGDAPPASALATDGPFVHGRNPVLLSVLPALVGASFAVNSAWVLLSAVPTFLFYDRFVVPTEESALRQRFLEQDDAYGFYVQTAPRWGTERVEACVVGFVAWSCFCFIIYRRLSGLAAPKKAGKRKLKPW